MCLLSQPAVHKMNILPKKSWHVLSRDNILRVRRDEAEAKAEEEEKQRRVEIAERESRLGVMRRRAHAREEGGEGDHSAPKREGGREESNATKNDSTGDGHINFFADMTQGVGLQLTNTEHEKEKKQEQEKFEKRVGILNYLVDKEKADEEPWYAKQKKSAEESAKVKRRKELMDPLTQMHHHLTAKRKSSGVGGASERTGKRHSSDAICSEPCQRSSEAPAATAEEGPKTKRSKKEKKREKQERLEVLRRERDRKSVV